MIERRAFTALGGGQFGWLDTKHHFSFGEYRDPDRINWGKLRVWNDDLIDAGAGFPPHPHANMEIITYVREGAISHQDSLGHAGRTEAGDVQVMSAGSGIRHAEFNQEKTPCRLFQIWIVPSKTGIAPRWETKPFPKSDRAGQFVVLASGYPEDDGALPIQADARLSGATLASGSTLEHQLAPERLVYLVVSKGEISVNGVTLHTGDGCAIAEEALLRFDALTDAELVMVETSP
jgi:redox-sensitive bicupin YhaK (pirin superfamily)